MRVRMTMALELGTATEVSAQTSNRPPSDVPALTSRIARGDEEAFETFYDHYSGQIFRFLLVLVRGNEDLAEELHQQVMIKAARKMPFLENEEQLWRWLSRVARNTWFDLLRKQRREGEGMEALKVTACGAMPEPADVAALERAMEALPETQRELIRSFYLERSRQKDIASRTGLSVKAIQCELARIRKKLRTFIERSRNAK